MFNVFVCSSDKLMLVRSFNVRVQYFAQSL